MKNNSHSDFANRFFGFILLLTMIFTNSFEKIIASELNGNDVKIISPENSKLSKFGIKQIKHGLEIAQLNPNMQSSSSKIVVSAKRISIKNIKKTEKFERILIPKLVVYKFKNGSSAYYPGFTSVKINDKSTPDKIAANIASQNDWVAIYTNIIEKNGDKSEVWIWYAPTDIDFANEELAANTKETNIDGQSNVKNDPKIDLSIYPNPASSQAKIALNLSEEIGLRISVYDLSGNEVQVILPEFTNITKGNSEYPIDIQQLQAGMYIVSIVTNKQIAYTSRLIVVK